MLIAFWKWLGWSVFVTRCKCGGNLVQVTDISYKCNDCGDIKTETWIGSH